jgi:NAD(P)-dependent dehydrogenase (short-subunit alcohol dehydrogenase family)
MSSVTVKRVLITGTTSGVGRALLEHYVERGTAVISVNRRRMDELESRYPNVRFECLDVRSAEEVARLVRGLAASGELPDVFILNAGINRIDNDERFELAPCREVLDTNLFGVLSFVAPLTELAPSQRQRHVLAISSMVNYVGNPYGVGYYASKRALTACFDVWAKMYAGTDLVFQQVMLGPVRTAIFTMASRLPRWMGRIKDLFSVSQADTARAVAGFALTRRKKLFYPRRALPLYLAMWLGQHLVPGFFQGRRNLDGKTRRAPPG